MKIKCDFCGNLAEKTAGEVSRAKQRGAKLFCNKACFGESRRKYKTAQQKKEEKRIYDNLYREKNADLLKKKKAAYFQRTYDPEKARIERKKRAAQHAEYCRRPEYKEWKKEYDRKHRAKKAYGDYWECFLLTQDIRDECLDRQSDYEIRLHNETLNKAQRRKRDVERKADRN